MKKFIYLVLAFALLFTGWNVYADTPLNPDYAYTRIVGGETPDGKPPMFIRKVRYGKQGSNGTSGEFPTLVSGTVVAWDLVSNDGVTVSECVPSTTKGLGIAGVLVTPLLSQDAGINTDVSDDHYGYMCVSGWCLANIDISLATDGYTLTPGNSVGGTFGTTDLMINGNSQDCGVLLKEASTDGLGAVMLKLQ